MAQRKKGMNLELCTPIAMLPGLQRSPDPAAMPNITGILASIAGIKSTSEDFYQDAAATIGNLNFIHERDDTRMQSREVNMQQKIEKRNSSMGILTNSGRQSVSSMGSGSALKPPIRQRRASFSLFPGKPSEADHCEERLDRLQEHLASYAISGLPMSHNLLFSRSYSDPRNLQIEMSWETFVESASNLSKAQKQQQAAFWELLQTEVNYIRQLTLLVDVYMAVFHDLQQSPEHFLADLNEASIFGNIGEVITANFQFWNSCLSLPLCRSRMTGEMMNPSLLKDGFLEIQNIFAPYAIFCQNYNRIISFIQTQEKDNPIFAAYLTWANNQNNLNREGLAGLLCQPFQRIMKYGLILSMMKKYTTDPQQCSDLEEMVQAIHQYLDQINTTMNERAHKAKLEQIAARLESYEVFETPGEEFDRLVETGYSLVRLVKPMAHGAGLRDLINQGVLRFREGQSKALDVHCFLFTDMMLICRPSKKNPESLRVYKSPIRIDKFIVKRHSDSTFAGIVMSDFNCTSAFYVFNGDWRRIDEWVERCREARKLYIERTCHSSSARHSTDSTHNHHHNHGSSRTISRLASSPGPLISNPSSNSLSSQGQIPPISSSTSSSPQHQVRSVPNSPTVADRRLRIPGSHHSTLSEHESEGGGSTPQPSPALDRRPPDQQPGIVFEERGTGETVEDSDNSPMIRPVYHHRSTRSTRRHRTMEAIGEPALNSAGTADQELHKRLSLNFSGQSNSGSTIGFSSNPGPHEAVVVGIPNQHSTSVESFQSSSGCSSAPSHQYSGSELSETNFQDETDSSVSTVQEESSRHNCNSSSQLSLPDCDVHNFKSPPPKKSL